MAFIAAVSEHRRRFFFSEERGGKFSNFMKLSFTHCPRRWTAVVILLSTLVLSCGMDAGPNVVVPRAGSEPKPETRIFKQDEELQKRLAAIAEEARGKVGVYGAMLEEGDGREVAFNADERFAMQSVVKLPIAMAILNEIDTGDELKLESKVFVGRDELVPGNMRSPIRDGHPKGAELTIRELIRYAVSESDGTAADVLQRVAGGAKGVQEFIDQLDIREMKVKYSHKEFGAKWEYQYDNWATPRAAFELLYMLWLASPDVGRSTRHSKESYRLLEQYMTEGPTGANRLKGLLPPGTLVAHKTGTGGTRGGVTSATNDVGIIRLPNGKRFAIAVFVRDSSADEKTREAVIAKTAKAVWDAWSK